MEMRIFGRTGLELSVLGFGCGAVGGLMVRGDPLDQERTIARAIAAGMNYFDTAVQYGNGESESDRRCRSPTCGGETRPAPAGKETDSEPGRQSAWNRSVCRCARERSR
jgi:hypothetical protein